MLRNEYDCFAQWGFSGSPFQTLPLEPDSRGERLFVGRNEELRQVKMRLHTPSKITCVEGDIGVGKTSLVNIAAYQCYQDQLKKRAHQLLIPCAGSAFQIDSNESVETFSARVFERVARTLLKTSTEISSFGLNMEGHGAVRALLENPAINQLQIGLAKGIGISWATQPNTSTTFSSTGIEHLVRKWLQEVFRTPGSGAVVCVIDNLELIPKVQNAMKVLEQLRDQLFVCSGLRWVLCGANGIVTSVLSSPRLGGYLIKPVVKVDAISSTCLPEILNKRRDEFAVHRGKEYLPITSDDFVQLYNLTRRNLRDTLDLAETFSREIFFSGNFPQSDSEKERRFGKWLDRETRDSYATLSKHISRDEWKVLDIAMSQLFNGTFREEDIGQFLTASPTLTKKRVNDDLNKYVAFDILGKSVETVGHNTVVTFYVTKKGALAHFGRLLKDGIQPNTSPEVHGWLKRVNR